MNVPSLTDLSIKKICETTVSASYFIEQSPLPWTLTKIILKKFPLYKWETMISSAKNDPIPSYKGIEFIACSKHIPSHLRNVVLGKSDWGSIFEDEHSSYCVWANGYYLKQHRLNVCKSCFFAFKNAHETLNKFLLVRYDHTHEVYDADDIVECVYQQPYYWCNSCFTQVLFDLKDYESCVNALHEMPRNNRFDDSEPEV
ncbi:uncharacterized protein LOC126893300 [Diabrotica virgifera virgifera]|uniref:Uncharacterized protein n=1 Tax=Diabrotica virgifera virgifera TaxID=50390 RepID=A0ABM5JHZ9_DIAVI|nr:uncharacterized protein LOC126878740 [Diabrotica virgifera virgifera]XP_050498485.1 uncharacterized protein LOC126879488 [Diabrotica virgifera virgifera]XP_050500281.1 uncharacterized protein LOC126880461 [Diabrotica virgifera virgifera]XP_050502887.1 uncharacterized protein LOC126882091 [Diabrotica virgifera virgifera]XP_050504459.1 uncharacterized protein LOC126883222 [Diabrotica virgifera virgifera]XP_050505664.1 uncharacterized protein LOC126883931 [Diabrotica virgifera virgifera]XP_05